MSVRFVRRWPRWLALAVACTALGLSAACLPLGQPRPDARRGADDPPPGAPVTATATAALTATVVATATPSVSATLAPTPMITATAAVTSTPAVTATPAMTSTIGPTPRASGTPDIAPTHAPTPTVGSPASIQLPLVTRNAVPASPRASVVWGAQFTFEEDAGLSAADIATELPRLKEAGARSIRMHLRWSIVEPELRTPPAYDWSTPDRLIGAYSRAGFDVVVSIVDYPAWAMVYRCGFDYRTPERAADWAAFVGAAAERYGKAPYRVAAWEIGNEVDGKSVVTEADRARPPEWGKDEPMPPQIGCWGDRPAAYLAFLKPAYGAVKAIDPDIPVSFGNLAYATTDIFHRDFLDGFLALDSGKWFDYVGYHWFPELKEAFPAEPTGPEKYTMIADRLARRGLRKPIWITETYRRTVQGDATSELGQVRFLTEELPEVLACCPVARVYWFAWTDFAGQEAGKHQRGLVRSDHAPKLAFPILRHTIQHTDGNGRDISSGGTLAYEFRPARSGVRTIIARRPDGTAGSFSVPAFPGETALLTTFPDDALRSGACCPQVRLTATGGMWKVPVGGRANYVRIVQRP